MAVRLVVRLRVFESCERLQIDSSRSATLDRAVVRLVAVLGVVVVVSMLALASPVGAQPTSLFPGVTYETGVQFTPHGPVAIHVVRGPRPVGLYRLRAVLSNEAVVGKETLSSMQRRLAPQATTVGVNGDYFSVREGRPSGILIRDGVLVSAPSSDRSSAGITLDGTMDVRRIKLFGTWRGLGQRRQLNAFNRQPGANGVALFTSDWGPATPRIEGATAMVLSAFPGATPNADLTASTSDLRQNASVPIAPGTAVLVARGTAAEKLMTEAPLGTTVTIRLILQPDWTTVTDAIGGGPVLVRDGLPVFRANEAFTTSQIAPRAPRTAVGQLGDGRVLLVAVDGRQAGYSIGMTTFEMAQTMIRLGAVRAMALDGGGSTTLAFDGNVLNQPSDGRERPIATALMLFYSGVYAPPPAESVVSPNGDGTADEQQLSFKIVRPSNVTVTLAAPDGTIAAEESGYRDPGTYDVSFPPAPPVPPVPPETEPPAEPTEPAPLAEGRWTFSVASADYDGQTSTAVRRFWVNSTLGYLKVQPRTLFLPPAGRNAMIQWTQERAGQVVVTLETNHGITVRTIAKQRFEPGPASVIWNGRLRNGRLAFGGLYRIRVAARNEVGQVSLDQRLRIRRVAGGH